MNVLYAKSVLYSYPHLSDLADQFDQSVERKALNSMTNYSPCIFQCEEILSLTEQKKSVLLLWLVMKKIILKLSNEEMLYLDYKYFKKMPKEVYDNFDTSSRNYFRKQVKLAEKVANLLEKEGVTDTVYQEKYLAIDFFKEMLKRVNELEEKAKKNKPLDKKLTQTAAEIQKILTTKTFTEQEKNTLKECFSLEEIA